MRAPAARRARLSQRAAWSSSVLGRPPGAKAAEASRREARCRCGGLPRHWQPWGRLKGKGRGREGRGELQPTTSFISQPSVSHQSVISQSSVSHQSACRANRGGGGREGRAPPGRGMGGARRGVRVMSERGIEHNVMFREGGINYITAGVGHICVGKRGSDPALPPVGEVYRGARGCEKRGRV